MQFPQMVTVHQTFDAPTVTDIAGTVQQALQRLRFSERIRPGQTVAITAGSRGIAHIADVTAACVQAARQAGADPFVVPAMGSHGGGTAEGQTAVLASLGITEESVGAPIRSSMDTVIVTHTASGVPVHFDRFASEADHVLVVNRIKPHTRFVGPVESGLHKMMLIGLGKHAGAAVYHQAILDHSFPEIVADVAQVVLEKCRVIGGLALVENGRDETALIEAVLPEEFEQREQELLQQANAWLPSLPVRQCDLLIVDRIGKDISGAGMDTNVIGRKFFDHTATADDRASCRRILVRSLTEATQGNACGIGLAEFTTQSCVDQIDADKTAINCITALHPEGAMIPITLPTDREAVRRALQTIGRIDPQQARVVQIADTLHLDTVRVSTSCLEDVRASETCTVDGEPYDFPFDEAGTLADI